MASTVEKPDAFAWLQSLSKHIEGLDEYRRRIEPQLASRFSLMRYMRTDEMGLSQILADLLDPNGPHGQGSRFLRCFLGRYWLEVSDIEDSMVKVRTEVSTDRIARRQRRIDIEVELGTTVLGIENKPWALDQQAQLTDYLKHLRMSGRRFKLLYLAGREDQQPSEQSISTEESTDHMKSGELELTSYTILRKWIRDCLRCCENERVSMFLRDLDGFIARQFAHEGVDFESRLIVEAATASDQSMHAAVQLANIGSELRLYLLARLADQLRIAIPEALTDAKISGWALKIPKALHERHAAVELSRHPNSALKLVLAFEESNCRDCAFGVVRRSPADAAMPEKLLKLDSAFGVGQSSDWWGWWRAFDYRNWWYEPQVWVQIADGSLAKKISEIFKRMIQALDPAEAKNMFDTESISLAESPSDHPEFIPSQLTRAIGGNTRLISRLLAVEAANLPLRRAIALRADAEIRAIVDAAIPGRCKWNEHGDLTERYAGIGFKLRDQPALEVLMEFQAGGCRSAIYGLRIDGIDGSSAAAANVRQQLAEVELADGKWSAGWVWYRTLDTRSWFDQPESAVSVRSGGVASQTATRLIELVQTIDRAGLRIESSPR